MSLPIPNNREQVYLSKVIDKNLENIPIPISRFEIYLKCLLDFDKDNLPTPISKQELILYDYILGNECNVLASNKTEMFLKALSTVEVAGLPTPQSKIDVFLDYIIRNGCLEKFEYYPFIIRNYLNVKNTPKAKMKFKGAKGNTLILNPSGEIVLPGTSGAIIKSFGESENKIEVLSVGKNLFNGNVINAYIDASSTKKIVASVDCRVSIFKVNKYTDYILSSNLPMNRNVLGYFKYLPEVGSIADEVVNIPNGIFNSKNYKYIAVFFSNNRTIGNMQLEYGTASTEYQPFQSSKSMPMYRNSTGELVPVPVLRGKWQDGKFLWGDEILEHDDGKLYYHKRCGIVNLKDITSWKLWKAAEPSGLLSFYANIPTGKTDSELICDRLINVNWYNSPWNSTIECVSILAESSDLYVYLKGVTTLDQAITKIIEINPCVIYQLKKEEVYPCELSEQLYSYDGETNIFINGGDVVGETTIEIGTKLGPIVDSIRQNVDRSTRAIEGLVSYGVQECAYQLYPEDFKNVPSVIEGGKNA